MRKISFLLFVLIVGASCAAKNGTGDDTGPLGDGRGGRGDQDELCDEYNEFFDIPGYEENFILTGTLGEYSMQPSGTDRFILRRNYIPTQILAMTFLPPDQAVSLGQNVNTESANVRFYLFNSCSDEDRPDYHVLGSSGNEYFPLSMLPQGGSVTVDIPDPYRYDVMAIEYVGQAGYINGQQGQIFPPVRSPTWSAGCLHYGGYCDI